MRVLSSCQITPDDDGANQRQLTTVPLYSVFCAYSLGREGKGAIRDYCYAGMVDATGTLVRTFRFSPTLLPYLILVASSIELLLKLYNMTAILSCQRGHPPPLHLTWRRLFSTSSADREWHVQDPVLVSSSSTMISKKPSSAQLQCSSIFHQLRPIAFGILR